MLLVSSKIALDYFCHSLKCVVIHVYVVQHSLFKIFNNTFEENIKFNLNKSRHRNVSMRQGFSVVKLMSI